VTRVLLLAGWMLFGVVARAADKIEPLDADFLEYLANMESDDDNWTLLDDPDHKPKPVRKPVTREANKEAAKPAAEER
jgi:hypothetical protein